MTITAQTQAGLYRARRRRQARLLLSKLTPWATGLVTTAGQFVSGENGTQLFKAITSGTTAGSGPKTDTGVTWVRTDMNVLLGFLNQTTLPTPA